MPGTYEFFLNGFLGELTTEPGGKSSPVTGQTDVGKTNSMVSPRTSTLGHHPFRYDSVVEILDEMQGLEEVSRSSSCLANDGRPMASRDFMGGVVYHSQGKCFHRSSTISERRQPQGSPPGMGARASAFLLKGHTTANIGPSSVTASEETAQLLQSVQATAQTSAGTVSGTLSSISPRMRPQRMLDDPRGSSDMQREVSSASNAEVTCLSPITPRRSARRFMQTGAAVVGPSSSMGGKPVEQEVAEEATPKARAKFGRSYEKEKARGSHLFGDDERQLKMSCDSLRALIFKADESKPKQAYDAKPPMKDVRMIATLWRELLAESRPAQPAAVAAGEAEIEGEIFVDYFASKSQLDRALALRTTTQLLGKTRRTFSREDLIRLAWPKTKEEDIRFTIAMLYLEDLETMRLPSPRPIPKRINRELVVNFRHISGDKKEVPFEDLWREGLVDREGMLDMRERYDQDGDGLLSVHEFIDMLCPDGYRSSKKSVRAVMSDGRPVAYVKACVEGVGVEGASFAGWLSADTIRGLSDEFKEAVQLESPI